MKARAGFSIEESQGDVKYYAPSHHSNQQGASRWGGTAATNYLLEKYRLER